MLFLRPWWWHYSLDVLRWWGLFSLDIVYHDLRLLVLLLLLLLELLLPTQFS